MANKKQMDSITFQEKAKVLRKLHLLGCKTEKALLSLSMVDVLRIENISVQDIAIILAMQKHVKRHTLFSYLGGAEYDIEENKVPPAKNS